MHFVTTTEGFHTPRHVSHQACHDQPELSRPAINIVDPADLLWAVSSRKMCAGA